jgi:hypothetical protein
MIPSLVALFLLVSACKDKPEEGKGGEPEIAWPEKPADGTPVAVKVLELMKDESKGPQARMRLFNFSDKSVERVSLTLHYKDGQGKELKTFPHTQMWPGGVESKDYASFKGGMFMPKETEKIEVEVKKVVFAGGVAWQKEPQP